MIETARTTRSQGGFTLLEVIVAIGILGFGLLTLAVMQLEALSQGAAGKHSSDAASVGRSYLEQVHRVPWTDLDNAQGLGFTAPNWAGAPAAVTVTVAMPGGAGDSIEHSYDVLWRVSDIAGTTCLRDVEVQVSWSEEDVSTAKTLQLASRRYNYGDPSC